LSVEVHKVNGPKVMSTNLLLFCFFFTKVPIALNATVPPVGTASGPLLNIVVGRAVGRAVKVGVALGVLVAVAEGVRVFVVEDVLVAVAVGVNVGVGGGPFAITIDSREKPGAGVMTGPPPPPPPVQLSRIAPKTNNTTGATTSHLSHRDNIKPTPMTDASARCQVRARFRRLKTLTRG
jgi:hypothetical protein